MIILIPTPNTENPNEEPSKTSGLSKLIWAHLSEEHWLFPLLTRFHINIGLNQTTALEIKCY